MAFSAINWHSAERTTWMWIAAAAPRRSPACRIAGLCKRLARAYPETNANIRVEPLQDTYTCRERKLC